MKEGWEHKKLGEVATFINGDRSTNYPSKKDYVDEGIPFVNAGNLIQDGLDLASLNLISQSKYDSLTQGKFVEGDILFCLRGTLGKHSIVQNGLKGAIASSLVILRTKEGFCNKYISYYLDYKQSYIERLNNGAAQPNIPAKTMKGFSVLLPPNEKQQQEIVTHLNSAFAKIDAMKANSGKALNEAKALFQASLKEMLEPKEGWEEKRLGDVAEDSADGPFGSNLKKEHYTTKKEVRIIQLSNIGEDGWREENTKYTTFEHLKNISRSEVEPNDIVIAKMMPAGRAILCPSHEAKFVLSSDAVKIKLKKGMLTRFILHSINSPYFRNEVYENVTGSGRVRTSLTKLRACSIYLPSLDEQRTIVETLDSLKSKVDRLQANFDKISQECDALKQAILRQVFE